LRVLPILLLTAIATAGAGYWYTNRSVAVTTILPSQGDAAEVVYATGVVEPRVWAKVTPLVRERIVEQDDREGERVQAGDILARLNSREAETVAAELQARLRLAEDDYQRLAVLGRGNAISQQELDRARSEVAQLEALVAGQAARLENYVLRAPIDGVVLRRDGEVGEIAEPGTVLFWVGRPQPLVVIADVNEEDIPRVAVGQRALLRSDAFPGRSLEAVVDNITPKGDPLTRTYRVRFRLPEDTPLMIGMSVDVNIVVRVSEGALLVPSLAVQGDEVFVVEDGVARRRQVKVGIRGMQAVEILSGIAEDARIVSPYPEGLVDEARVAVAGE
jgi:membrane fusion protein, multidrug efflux system